MDTCPLCSKRDTGKVGNDQFFCSNSCVEYDSKQNIFAIDEDGTLIDLEM